jgi:hypothetical protein
MFMEAFCYISGFSDDAGTAGSEIGYAFSSAEAPSRENTGVSL